MEVGWERVKEVFGEASELTGPARQSYLDEACRDQPELRAEVARLLAEQNAGASTLPTSSIWERPPAFASQQVLDNRFEILRLIGRGGYGEVYEVQDQLLNRRVALKTLRRDVLNDAAVRERFKREIRVAQRISHHNVCRVFDVILTSSDDAEIVSFTMELLAGETLAEFLSRCGTLDQPRASAR